MGASAEGSAFMGASAEGPAFMGASAEGLAFMGASAEGPAFMGAPVVGEVWGLRIGIGLNFKISSKILFRNFNGVNGIVNNCAESDE
jgi:hypothetical protein